jgi:putative Holliday junction resolvase
MRILALDIGEKRCGLAISDASGAVASPLTVLEAKAVLSCAPAFQRILQDHEPQMLLCGLPLSMSGEPGPQAQRIQQQAQELAQRIGLPLKFSDERLSSAQAKRALRQSGHNERSMRGKVDMIAATLFLQSYLDSQRQPGTAIQEG